MIGSSKPRFCSLVESLKVIEKKLLSFASTHPEKSKFIQAILVCHSQNGKIDTSAYADYIEKTVYHSHCTKSARNGIINMDNMILEHSSSPETSLLENVQMFKALGDETRLRILGLLSRGELCVCDIMEVLKLPQSTASRHLAYLKNSKLVCGTRRGKWMYYQLDASILNGSVYHQIIQYLAGLAEIQTDHQKLVCHLDKKDKQSCN